MFLAVDLGNSNIVLGVYHDKEWLKVWRTETVSGKSSGEYAVLGHTFFKQSGIEPKEITQGMIASVVPSLTGPMSKALADITGISPRELTHNTETGIVLETERPEEVGPDLIAGAVGAYERVRDTCIVVDFGTATTLMAIKNPGVLTGGAICAGLRITADALINSAELLDDIPLKPPSNVLAKETVGALQSGLVLGHVAMVEGLISRIKEELGPAKVVATGGLVETLAPHTDCFDIVDPLLTLEGLRIIGKRQKADGRN